MESFSVIYRFAFYLVSLLLVSCAASDQDAGGDETGFVSGRTVDGYLASAIVFVDTNENGILEAWEPRALTDTSGYYSYNPNVPDNNGTNYCALPKSDKRYRHCLKTPPNMDEGLIVTIGGYDITTNEPFEGTITRRSSFKGALDVPSKNVASPLTTLLAHMSDAHQLEFGIAESLSVEELHNDMLLNLIDIPDASVEATRRATIKTAIQAHKVADIVINYLQPLFLDDSGTESLFGSTPELPPDASIFVYKAIADDMTNNLPMTSLNTLLNDPSRVWDIIVGARDIINAEISTINTDREKHGQSPLPLESTLSIDTPEDIAARVSEVGSFIDTLFSSTINATGMSSDQEDIEARLRAVEVVTSVLRDPAKANVPTMDESAQRAIDLALGTGTAVAADADIYLAGLKSARTDIRALVDNFNVNAGLVVPEDSDFASRQDLNNQIGTGTLGTDEVTLDLESSKDQNNTAGFVFNPDGTLTAAIDYTDADNSANNLSPDDPIEGSWEQINDYTIIANMEVAGEVQPLIIRTNSDGSGYLFDFGGEIVEWN